MQNIKKLLPLIFFVSIFVVGFYFVLTVGLTFLALSLLLVGGIGMLSLFFINISTKKFVDSDDNQKLKNLSSTIKQQIENLPENNENKLEEFEPIKHKKIKCTYCKCKFDDNLSRCPNCGAPPDFDK